MNLEELNAAIAQMSERFDKMQEAFVAKIQNAPDLAEEHFEVNTAIYFQRDMSMLNDKADELKKMIGKLYDWSRTALVPEKMEGKGIETIKLEGVGRVSLTSDMSVSMPDKESGYAWLIENEAGDLITETVNASTLKAFIRRRLKDGQEVPEDVFRISPFTRATITKV